MAYSPQNPPLPWPLMAFLADAISGECSDKQAQPPSSATLNCSAAWPPGHSWPHLARPYLQENGVGITVISLHLIPRPGRRVEGTGSSWARRIMQAENGAKYEVRTIG